MSPNFCESLPHLKILDLRDNKIETLPDEIGYLQALIRLDLTNNSINRYSSMVDNYYLFLIQLRSPIIKYIFSLPNSLSVLSHLVNLQLEGNPIRSIRRDIIQSGTYRILQTLKARAAQANETLPSVMTPSSSIGENETTFPDKYVF